MDIFVYRRASYIYRSANNLRRISPAEVRAGNRLHVSRVAPEIIRPGAIAGEKIPRKKKRKIFFVRIDVDGLERPDVRGAICRKNGASRDDHRGRAGAASRMDGWYSLMSKPI
ncbi:MAG TPA: hypothetical protein VG326_17270 [Tepidisphaeraceae bacterium]|jgi:hypothetical protein|nr:hypothetical protein [Tepidisphaeraceae bacterium]